MPLEITNGIGKVGIRTSAAVVSIDSDAQAFITAAALTDTTQKNAIDELVKDLKAANIWTKMKAIYPFVGGTAEQHRFNLKDPRTVNEAFYLTFYGGGTHGPNGYQPNGNSYADTKLGANLLTSTNHLSYYSRNITVNTEVELGVYDNLPSAEVLQLRAAVNYVSGQAGSGGSSVNFTTTTNAKGLWVGTKRAFNDREVFLNGTSQGTNTGSENSTLPSINVYLGARNSGGTSAQLYSTKECAFASIGSDGLTSANVLAFYNAVQAYQTTLNRQVP